jgi:hypothetical protein
VPLLKCAIYQRFARSQAARLAASVKIADTDFSLCLRLDVAIMP